MRATRDRRRIASWATAAGLTGLLANALLAGYYALEVGREPLGPVSLGSLNDLVGAVGTALMVPVALAFGPRWVRLLGLTAMGVLTVTGPLLFFGVVTFAAQVPIALAAFMALAAWIVLTSRHVDGAMPASVSRLGVLCGGGVLAGAAVVGMAFLLPWMSWPQLVVWALGGVPAVLAWLAIPVWFLLLGRAPAAAPEPVPARR
jgi:hypothetical protein